MKVYLDTNCIIYFVENNPVWFSKVVTRIARLRAVHPFKLPDALHLATAIEHGCGLFLTNDAKRPAARKSPWKS